MSSNIHLHIACYSTSYNATILDSLPFVRFFYERSLWMTLLLKQTYDRVIILADSPVADSVIDYHLVNLLGLQGEELKSAKSRLKVIVPKIADNTLLPIEESVLADPSSIDLIKAEISLANNASFHAFTSSDSLDLLAATLGLKCDQPPVSLAEQWGSKSGSRQLLSEANVPIPRGTLLPVSSLDLIQTEVSNLLRQFPNTKKLLLKLNSSAWGDGLGQVLIDLDLFRKTEALRPSMVAFGQEWPVIERELLRDGAIIEEFIPNILSCPSGQGVVDLQGKVTVISAHDQVMDGTSYVGCCWPVGEEIAHFVHDSVKQVGECLAQRGVWGHFGVDFILTDDGKMMGTEINLRKVGPSHVQRYVNLIVESRNSIEQSLKDNSTYAYINKRYFKPDQLRLATTKFLLREMQFEQIEYNRETNQGILLHLLTAYDECGYLEMTAIARNIQEAKFILQKAEILAFQ
ncbi:MAG: ATP-grasp domain-containing protein [Moorea sp. SIO2I5]|nr:ATP-grasp domain-containing protein [Moorena sp. SIO2I5]